MQGKTILITGASRGIGEQLAYCYAHRGVNLILVARKAENLIRVVDGCQQRGANTISESIDVRDAVFLKSFIHDVDKKTPIDLVIANAGVSSSLQCDWQQESEEDIEQVFSTNVQGTLNTINPLLKPMISRKKGQIVIMSSLAGLRGLPHSPSYCASKASLYVYGQSLRSWLGRYHINVNVVCPGYVKTDMSDRLTGPKPFLISSEKAAILIQKRLLKNQACIAFPWQLSLLTKLAVLMPAKPVDMILNRIESYVQRD